MSRVTRANSKKSLRASVLSQSIEQTNKTITLDSSKDTDIIESSVVEINDRYEILKSPRANLRRSFATESRNDIISWEKVQTQEVKSPLIPCSSPIDVSIITGSSFQAQPILLTHFKVVKSPVRPRSSIFEKKACPKRKTESASQDQVTHVKENTSPNVKKKIPPTAKQKSLPPAKPLSSSESETQPTPPNFTASKLRYIEKWLEESPPNVIEELPPIKEEENCPPAKRRRTCPHKVQLTGSKLQNVQQWLNENEFEKDSTPPFADLSDISVIRPPVRTPVTCKIHKTVENPEIGSFTPEPGKTLENPTPFQTPGKSEGGVRVCNHGYPFQTPEPPKTLKTVKTVRTAKTPKTPKTAVTLKTPKTVGTLKTPKTGKEDLDTSSSSVNSAAKEILIAVYGPDWKKQNVLKKSKTEVKRKPAVKTGTKTEIKPRKEKPGKNVLATPQPVRRNLLGEPVPKGHDDSIASGIEEIQLDDFVIARKTPGVKRKIKMDDYSDDDQNSIASLTVPKKKNKVETPKNPPRTRSQAPLSGMKTPKKTFLASLSPSTPTRQCHPEAEFFKLNFKTKKQELAQKLFKLYNSEIFQGKLPENMVLEWNVHLRGTAGYCRSKKIVKSTGEIVRTCKIELSTKVLDRADRLRDTLLHELCHAACWVIDGVLDGHGELWKKWAAAAKKRFPEIPEPSTCHNYQIMSKYTYRCTGCAYAINRHSKSIDIERKRCGYCYGVLELLRNKKKRGKTEVPEYNTTRTIRTPNNFALFVKENYSSVKCSKAGIKHAEVMKILSQQYAISKTAGTPQPLPSTSDKN